MCLFFSISSCHSLSFGSLKAYEGLKTADKLKEEYLFIPAKVKEVYLAHLLSMLKEVKVRSAIIFASTCKGCHLLSLVLGELGLPCASLHSGESLGDMEAAADSRTRESGWCLDTFFCTNGLS